MSKVLAYLASVAVAMYGIGGVVLAQDTGQDKANGTAVAKSGHRQAGASGRAGHALMRMKRLDSDRNGTISKSEMLAPRSAEFKDLDSNRDSAIDAAEIGAALSEPAQFRTRRFMKRADANRDGKITRDEYEQAPRAQFAGRDINSDGKINAQDRPPHNGSGFGWFGGGHGKKMGLGAGRHNRPDVTLETVLARTQAEFNKIDGNTDGVLDQAELGQQSSERIEFSKKRAMHWMDQNKDGRLSEEEFLARVAKRFAMLDLNDDGQIDGSDFPASGTNRWFAR